MVLGYWMYVFVGLADFMTEFFARAVSAEGTLAGASLIAVGTACLLWARSGGGARRVAWETFEGG